MDGWTDRYNALPYFATRLSCIINCEFHIIPLCVFSVESPTAAILEKFVEETLKKFLDDDYRNIKFFNTIDDAVSMLRLFKNLNHDRSACVAHSLQY